MCKWGNSSCWEPGRENVSEWITPGVSPHQAWSPECSLGLSPASSDWGTSSLCQDILQSFAPPGVVHEAATGTFPGGLLEMQHLIPLPYTQWITVYISKLSRGFIWEELSKQLFKFLDIFTDYQGNINLLYCYLQQKWFHPIFHQPVITTGNISTDN